MIFGIPIWDDRVSPVLDVASKMIVVESRDGCEVSRSDIRLSVNGVGSRAQAISEMGIELVVCAGASIELVSLLSALGVQVRTGVVGPVESIVSALVADGMVPPGCQMPGCRGGRFRRGLGACGRTGRHFCGGRQEPGGQGRL